MIDKLKKHPKAYFSTDNGVLLCGDCLEIMHTLPGNCLPVNLILTDPVWPNNTVKEFSTFVPEVLFKNMYIAVSNFVPFDRMVIVLGCDTNPSMLSVIGAKYLRTVWLRVAVPGHKGRILHSGDVAYCYGNFPKSEKGRRLLRGEKTAVKNFGKEAEHPCPRKLEHILFLVNDWSREGELVFDPFLGSGTTAVACEKLGRKWIGIEISEKYCSVAAKRIDAEALQMKLFV